MKLQKQLSRKVGAKEYPKWVVTISPKQIEALGWKEGEDLGSDISDQMLIIRKEDEQKVQKRKRAAEKAWETIRKKKGGKA